MSKVGTDANDDLVPDVSGVVYALDGDDIVLGSNMAIVQE